MATEEQKRIPNIHGMTIRCDPSRLMEVLGVPPGVFVGAMRYDELFHSWAFDLVANEEFRINGWRSSMAHQGAPLAMNDIQNLFAGRDAFPDN